MEPLISFISPIFQKKLPTFLAEPTNIMLYSSSKYHLLRKNLYKKKIELIVKRVEDMYGKDFNKSPRFQQKIVMDSLKKDIKSKVILHSKVIDEKSIDSLIDAVDKKIDRSKRI